MALVSWLKQGLLSNPDRMEVFPGKGVVLFLQCRSGFESDSDGDDSPHCLWWAIGDCAEIISRMPFDSRATKLVSETESSCSQRQWR